MANRIWSATSRTGGGAGALDAIDGNLLTLNDGATVIMSTFFGVYSCTVSSSAENDPISIRPDTNPGAFTWERVTT